MRWVELRQSADGLRWIGSHKMDSWTTLCDTFRAFRGLCVCLSVGYTGDRALQKTDRLIEMPFWADSGGPKKPLLHDIHGCTHWRHLANATEGSVCATIRSFDNSTILTTVTGVL